MQNVTIDSFFEVLFLNKNRLVLFIKMFKCGFLPLRLLVERDIYAFFSLINGYYFEFLTTSLYHSASVQLLV